MFKYTSIISIVILISACIPFKNNKKEDNKSLYTFPFEWIGSYEGQLEIFNHPKDTSMVVDMKLEIGSPNNEGYYPWRIQYGEDDIRPYFLEAINPEIGHYRIDERNSIELDGYIKNGHFITRFEVMGNDLLFDYERVDEGILAQIFISKSQSENITGGDIIGTDTIPYVNNYKVVVFQKALLKKIE